jgi:hypothetical protein
VPYGLAFLIKPFIAIPVAASWFISSFLARGSGEPPGRLVGKYTCAIAGGLAVVCLAALWLLWSGNWPYFWSNNFGGWNEDYYATSESLLERTTHAFQWFGPWTWLHFVGVPLAVAVCVRALGRAWPDGAQVERPVLAALYLGWLFQAVFLQHQLPYQMVPPVLLAITFLAGTPALRGGTYVWLGQIALVVALAWATASHPLFRPSRLAYWRRCWTEGSSPAIRNGLAVEKDLSAPDWVRLAEVAASLRSRQVGNGELTCYAPSSVHLYVQLGVKPSTRYILIMPAMAMFPNHRGLIQRAIIMSRERYVINDLRLLEMTPAEANEEVPGRPLDFAAPPARAPPNFREKFPFTFPIVFRAGRYLVHEIHPARSPVGGP